MILPDQFHKIMGKLSKVKKPLEDEQEGIYYDFLKNTSSRILERAVDILIDSHRTRFFPTVPEIKDAISEAYQELEKEEEPPRPGICFSCNSTGVILKPYKFRGSEYTMAIACNCEAGKPFKKSFSKHKVYIQPELEEPGPWIPTLEEEYEPEEKKDKPDPY